jgi:murein L,D-transpeptidase YcbB/YkuD
MPMDRRIGCHSRCIRAALVSLACMLLAPVAQAQSGDGNWWDRVLGYNSGSDRSTAPAERKPDPLDDIRSDATPWRSDAMVEAIELAIQRYQKIVSAGGWPLVPPGQPARMMRPGDGDDRVGALRKRLAVSGDLPKDASTDNYNFGSDLEEAVRRFQSRHGIRVSGRVDQPTFAALNVSAESRLAQLKLNLQRIRELMQQRVEDRYLLVNVPAFQLEAVEKFEVQQRHRVIVGRTERQTPVIKATVKALNFFPYWRVPDSVAQLDLIPRLRKEPQYLEQEGIRVFTADARQELDPRNIDWTLADSSKIKFKQDPGDKNALGLVRIDMQNPEGVYMHDTPMKKLFDQRGRAFSAGCVRVQGVFKLVEWIARNEIGWEQPGRVESVIQSGQALDVNLTHPIPVYFTYITAWAEQNGLVAFRPDLYDRDGGRELVAGRERDPSDPPPPAPSLAP